MESVFPVQMMGISIQAYVHPCGCSSDLRKPSHLSACHLLSEPEVCVHQCCTGPKCRNKALMADHFLCDCSWPCCIAVLGFAFSFSSINECKAGTETTELCDSKVEKRS